MTVIIAISAEASRQNELVWNRAGEDYVKSLCAAGAVPVIVPFVREEKLALEFSRMCDGLLLPGGRDVDPCFYSTEKMPYCGETDKEFDRWQMLLLKSFTALGKPVFGICRGLQVINVYYGGTLYQDIGIEYADLKETHFQKGLREETSHFVKTVEGSRIKRILGESCMVNSFHHQAIRKAGSGLHVTATSSDGLIEGIFSDDGLVSGVQWHPENFIRIEPDPMIGLFEDFVDQCRRMKRMDNA